MSIWRQVLRAGANVEPGPRISFRGDVLCSLRVCPGKCARNIFHIWAVCLFLANKKKETNCHDNCSSNGIVCSEMVKLKHKIAGGGRGVPTGLQASGPARLGRTGPALSLSLRSISLATSGYLIRFNKNSSHRCSNLKIQQDEDLTVWLSMLKEHHIKFIRRIRHFHFFGALKFQTLHFHSSFQN